ncbi:MAG: EamA family transporter [Bacteroidales bacterium]|nr:EamA family transporter [Candidatus Cacconaster caballi]
MSIKLIWLSVLQSFLLAAAQMTLKMAMVRLPRFHFVWDVIRQYLTSLWFALCGVLFASATVLWMYIIKHYPLSQAYPMTSIAYIFGMLAGIFIFHESASLPKWIGLVLIIAGAVLLTRE